MGETLQHVAQPTLAGHCRGLSGVVVVLSGDDQCHEWDKLPDSVGLFACRDRECLWYAVCPGCLGSLDVALRVRDGVVGMALYWCPAHQGGGAHDG